MSNNDKYTIKKEIDEDNISSFYRLHSDGTKEVEVEMPLTEKEVRKLASQLPEKQLLHILAAKSVDVDEIEKVSVEEMFEETTDDVCSHAHDGDDMQEKQQNCKVSDCCGAEMKDDKFMRPYICKSCGEPCDAVEEKAEREIEPPRKEILRGNWDVQKNRNKILEIINWINEQS